MSLKGTGQDKNSKMGKYENLKFRILIPLVLAIIMLLGTFVFGVYSLQKREILLQAEARLNSCYEIFQREIENETTNLNSIIEVLQSNRDFQSAWLKRDRQALRQLLSPIFGKLYSENVITQLYLHDLHRINFMRVHKEKMYGDIIDRTTLIQAEKTGRPTKGIELGSMGIFTLRVVHPWRINGKLVGYIELGNEIGHIAKQMHDDLNVDVVITINKTNLVRDRWEAGLRMLGRKDNWEQFSDIVIIDKTIDEIPNDLTNLLVSDDHSYLEPLSEVTIAEQRYSTGIIPLHDVERRIVGEMVVLFDITEQAAVLRNSFIEIITVSIIVCLGLVLLFYIILSQTERKLYISRKRAIEEAQARQLEQSQHIKELKLKHTDLLKSKEAIRQSELRFRDIAENMADWIWEVDENGVFTYCSDNVQKILGYESNEIVGQTPFALMPPEEAKGVVKIFLELSKAQKPVKDLENWNIHKDGRHICLLTNGIPLFDKNRKLSGYRGVNTDITERKRAAEEKAKLENQLSQNQKMQAIGTLAGGIAHDFNNILSTIFGFTEFAKTAMPDSDRGQGDLDEVLKAANRAKDLVKQILTFSRQVEHERKPIEIYPIIKESIRLLRASLPTTIEIRQNLDPNCGAILADPTQIHQVLMNLCTNAYHAMQEQGGILGIDLKAVEVDAEYASTHQNLSERIYLRLTICDTGKGMDHSTMQRIYEPFFTTKDVGRGTGLGLSIVHGIVTNFGGEITVYSELGKGTTFNVYLPQIDSETESKMQVSEFIPKGNESILFIDDEEQLTYLGKRMLEKLGYSVTIRTSSIEALEAFRAQPDNFDLIITDMTMPNLTGLKLAKEILDIRPEIPIILMTGYSELVTPEKAKRIGIKEYIMKPAVTADLGKAIRKVLDGKNTIEKVKA
ncbi:MAG: PAS domain S-box protein [candidate division Zixibacteria bacterium]|nr:PAS domain S-box protein [candidate division Zixibacteria bacterium]